ncbi:MAG: rhomboid family intramembrane serine protease [Armatimonadota bacterium]
MDVNYVLAWITGASCAFMLFGLLKSSERPRGWVGVCLLVPAVMLAAWLIEPAVAGYVGGGLWAVLVLAPMLLSQAVSRAMMRQQFTRAARLSTVSRLLHPWDGQWEMPAFFTALAAERRGDLDAAERYFTDCIRTACPIGHMAHVYLFRLRGQWEEFLQWAHVDGRAGMVAQDVSLTTLYLRALGETGDLPGLLDTFRQRRGLIMAADPLSVELCALAVFAFSGHRRGAGVVLDGALAGYPAEVKDFWRATAELAAGDEGARERFAALLASDNHTLHVAAQRRLERPLADPRALPPEQVAEIDRLADELEREEHYRARPRELARAYATYALIGVNGLVFVAETLLGGSTSVPALLRLGAGNTALVFGQHEWWRLLTAQFLHYGWLHLGMNMLALLVFGRVLEARLGARRYLLAYFVAGTAAVLFAILPLRLPDMTVVGASGSIMGLIGAYGASSLLGWVRERARLARAQLNTVLVIVVAQTVFDQLTPQVSGIAHLSGAAVGFLVTLLLLAPAGARAGRPREATA